jgi:hypothetical protein
MCHSPSLVGFLREASVENRLPEVQAQVYLFLQAPPMRWCMRPEVRKSKELTPRHPQPILVEVYKVTV